MSERQDKTVKLPEKNTHIHSQCIAISLHIWKCIDSKWKKEKKSEKRDRKSTQN